jgi:hypothetical protein
MSRSHTISRRVTKAASGANTIVTVGATQRLVLKKLFGNVASDVTGDVYVYVGTTATEIGGIQSPIAGGNHIFVSNGEEPEVFPKGADLFSNQPDTTNIEWTAVYQLEDE